MCWRSQHKWLLISESHDDSNWCTWETWYTWHIRFSRQFTYVTRTLPADSPRTWQPFARSSTMLDRATAHEKKGSRPDPQHINWPIYGSIPGFSPIAAIEAVGVKPNIRWETSYINLLGSYLRHVISTFNTCSWGPTHRSFIDIDDGYNIEGIVFLYHSTRSSQPTVLRFP
jgi:hypothetical protein